MDKNPVGISNHIFRFLSHPVADATRDRISECQACSNQRESSSDLHTLYIHVLLDNKIHGTMNFLDDGYETIGGARGRRGHLLPTEPLASLREPVPWYLSVQLVCQ